MADADSKECFSGLDVIDCLSGNLMQVLDVKSDGNIIES